MSNAERLARPTGASLSALKALWLCRLPTNDDSPEPPPMLRELEHQTGGEVLGWHGSPDASRPGTYALACVEIATAAAVLRWTSPAADYAPTFGLDLGPRVGWLEVLHG